MIPFETPCIILQRVCTHHGVVELHHQPVVPEEEGAAVDVPGCQLDCRHHAPADRPLRDVAGQRQERPDVDVRLRGERVAGAVHLLADHEQGAQECHACLQKTTGVGCISFRHCSCLIHFVLVEVIVVSKSKCLPGKPFSPL